MDYFTFEIDGKPVGYYEELDENGEFYCNARMVFEGVKVENPFWIRHKDGKVLAYKVGDADFVEYDQPAGVYPSSAIRLVLQQMGARTSHTYYSFDESRSEVTGIRTLKRTGNRVEEFSGDQVERYFVLEDWKIVEYGWGGSARSRRVNSLEEAQAGTAFA